MVGAGGAQAAGQRRRLEALLRLPENRSCADCAARQPRWASTNLGLFLCLRCAGLHRALGTDISKVKSTTMDTWEEAMIEQCERIGNERARQLYEHEVPPSARPTTTSENAVVERFIRDKYERRRYAHPQYGGLLRTFLQTPPECNGNEGKEKSGECTGRVESQADTVPMLWDAAIATPAPETNGQTDCASLGVDAFFAPEPLTQGQTKQEHQVQRGAAQGDVKAEIMSLFTNQGTTHQGSAHVYSAWEPRQVQKY